MSGKHRIPKLWKSALSASVNTGSYTDTFDRTCTREPASEEVALVQMQLTISKMVHELMRKASCARATRDEEGLPRPRHSTSGHGISVFRSASWTRPVINQQDTQTIIEARSQPRQVAIQPSDSISALQRSTRSVSRGGSSPLRFFLARARVVACEYANEVSSIAEQDLLI